MDLVEPTGAPVFSLPPCLDVTQQCLLLQIAISARSRICCARYASRPSGAELGVSAATPRVTLKQFRAISYRLYTSKLHSPNLSSIAVVVHKATQLHTAHDNNYFGCSSDINIQLCSKCQGLGSGNMRCASQPLDRLNTTSSCKSESTLVRIHNVSDV